MMSIHKIEKQQLLYEPLSKDALKFAKAVYNTYLEDPDELFLEIKIKTVLHLLNLNESVDSIHRIRHILEELNEPICVRNFKYFSDLHPMRFVYFCTYLITEDSIELELSEEYLCAIEDYMIDPYLKS
ncbi:MAG: hypothetical protein U9N33_11360 [Campylobacterota bacterium]|nr:hypothetical protein [Campylobacterota bacterium]